MLFRDTPGAYTSSYYASKAFVYHYTRALQKEAKNKRVTISVLCPGATATSFFESMGSSTPIYAMSAKKVAQITYKAFERRKQIIIPGLRNKLFCLIPLRIRMHLISTTRK